MPISAIIQQVFPYINSLEKKHNRRVCRRWIASCFYYVSQGTVAFYVSLNEKCSGNWRVF